MWKIQSHRSGIHLPEQLGTRHDNPAMGGKQFRTQSITFCVNRWLKAAEEWVNNCWWGWQNRTDLGKTDVLTSATKYKETIVYKYFPQQMSSSGVRRERENQRRRKQRRGQTTKEEGSKEGDRQRADVKQTNVFVYMYTVDGGCRLEVRNNKRATARVPDFISSFLLDGTCEGPM